MKSFIASSALLYGFAVAQQGYEASSTASCAAPGSTSASGEYSCNPAHSYPAGQTCNLVNGCYVLSGGSSSSSSASASASATASCAAPGAYDSQGQYSCNPAHQYPAGQTCTYVNGCPVLVTASASATATATGASATGAASATPSCAAPGAYDSQGQYSCNPAHQYPAGQTCTFVNGCPVLVNGTSSSGSGSGSSTATAGAPSSSGAACGAPGTTNSMGQYSCNPAHAYPAGQTCTYVNGCPVLVSGSGSGSSTNGTTGGSTGSTGNGTSSGGLTPYTGAAASNQVVGGFVAIAIGAVAVLFL